VTPDVITFLPEAEEEIEASVRWYERRRRGLGLEFIAALDRVLTRIAENPRVFPEWPDETRYRRTILDRFPYVVFFEIRPAEIEVVAVAHARQKPGYWRDRGR
jgi:plasmid stabilization system protein ParE